MNIAVSAIITNKSWTALYVKVWFLRIVSVAPQGSKDSFCWTSNRTLIACSPLMGGGYFGKSTFKPDRFRLPLDLPFCLWPKPLRYSEMCSFQGMYILLDFAKNGQFSPKQRKWQEHPNMSNPYQEPTSSVCFPQRLIRFERCRVGRRRYNRPWYKPTKTELMAWSLKNITVNCEYIIENIQLYLVKL